MGLRFELVAMNSISLSVAWIPRQQDSKNLTYPMFRIEVEPQEAEGGFRVIMRLKIEPSRTAEYSLESCQVLLCRILGDGATEERRKLAAVNGATVLYGALRGQIALMTGSFPGGSILLPAVYMGEIWDKHPAANPALLNRSPQDGEAVTPAAAATTGTPDRQ